MNLEFQATGTVWKIDFDSPTPLEEIIRSRISEFEKNYSRFRDDSFVSKISNTTGEFTLPDDAKPLLDLYFDLFEKTEGLFTPLIGQNLNESGYDKNYSLTPQKLTKVADLIEAVGYNFPKIKIKQPVQFDFGGIGKGYLIDIVADLLRENNTESFTIDAGGDILQGSSSITIGLEHPEDKSKVIGKVTVLNQSICASSGNRRNWGKFHHIINPKKMESPQNILATWVIAQDAITADALATCLFLVSPEKLNRYYNYEYLILNSDYTFSKSDGLNAEIY